VVSVEPPDTCVVVVGCTDDVVTVINLVGTVVVISVPDPCAVESLSGFKS